MEIEWGPEIAVDGKRPEWLGDGEWVECYGKHLDWWDGCGGRADEWDGWKDYTAIKLPASHSAYIAIAKGFTPWSGGDEAPGDWDGENLLLDWGKGEIEDMDRATHGGFIDWRRDPDGAGSSFANVIGYRRKPETISPQPIGSSTVTGLSIKVDTIELKAAIAATAFYTVTRDGLTITGPDLAHILRSIKEGGE